VSPDLGFIDSSILTAMLSEWAKSQQFGRKCVLLDAPTCVRAKAPDPHVADADLTASWQ
jgi:hypothetical protein